jgi:outer membrane protein insertion porin family
MQWKRFLFTGLSSVFLFSICIGILCANYGYSGVTGPTVVSAEPIVSKILVDIQGLLIDDHTWTRMTKSLIFFQEGDRFSSDKLQASIEALKQCNRFQKIDVDSREEKEGITLLFRLVPFRLIKDIKIDGASPLFEREVLQVMTVYVGDAFVEEELSQQATLIANLFRKQGFVAPKINVTGTPDSEDGHFTIHVRIEKGPYYKLERLEILGNRAFSDTRLKVKMKTWRVSHLLRRAGRFIEEDLKNDIKKLKHYYWKKGFADAAVDYRLERYPERMGVSVFVTVTEDSLYKIELVGNERFWDRTLKKDLILFKDGNQQGMGLKKSIREMKRRYREAGYLEAKVKIEEKIDVDKKQSILRFQFVIDEGPCSIVDSIQITGNTAFDDKKLQKQMLTRIPGFLKKGVFVPETLGEDLDAIRFLYRKYGYLDAQVNKELTWSEDKTRVGIRVEIEEGVQTIVSSVKITGLSLLSEAEALKPITLQVGTPFRKYMVQSDENTLSAMIAEKGYPRVEVKGTFSISEDHKACVVYDIHEGAYVEMGEVYYKGNFRTKQKILENELTLKPGEPFSLRRMLQGQRSIRNLNILESVRFNTIGLKEKKDKVDLFVEMEEKKPYYLQAGGGYDSERGFFAHTRLGDHNLFGTNKDAWLAGEVSQIGYRNELGLSEPRLFGSRISTTSGAFLERREEFNQVFGTETYGASLGFSRRWLKLLNTDLNFRFERREQFAGGPEEAAIKQLDGVDEFDPRSILVTTPAISYDSRDSFIQPKKGIFSRFSVDISRGLSNELDDFLRYYFDFRYYWTPLDRLTFAWLGRVGHVDPYGSNEKVPEDQLFFLGGISDVRGFEENMLRFDAKRDPVGGRTAMVGSVEARIDLSHNVELAAFYDTGSVRNTFTEAGSDAFRDSVGLGLRYVTAVGPIGLLYGIKLDRKKEEKAGRFHFSIGYTF